MISNKRRRPLLASSIALALMIGVPAASFAITFEGVKFNDLNGNGAQDPGEKGIASQIIYFRRDAGFSNTYTDANGFYSVGVSITSPTNFTLWTGIPDGHQQTTPVSGEGMVTYNLSAQPNDKITVNFGIWDGIERVDDPDKLIVDAGLNQAVDAGDRTLLNGSFTDTQDSDKYNVEVEFGDGNRVEKIVSAETASSVRRGLRDGKGTTGTLDAKNTFLEEGTYDNTVTVTNAQGQTGTDTNQITVKDVAKSDPCATGIANVQTTQSGAWTDPNTWSPVGVPDENDWVMIQGVHTVTMPKDMTSSQNKRATITGLCVKGTLQSADNSLGSPPTWVTVYPKTLHNQGTIQGKNGINGSGPWCKPAQYQHATNGSPIFLGYPTKFINDGKIQAGHGGIDSTWKSMNDGCGRGTPAKGGHGGTVEVNAGIFHNNGPDGLIKAGNGGFADRVGTWAVHAPGIGGDGGEIVVTTTNMEQSHNTGKIESGSGGHAEIYGGGGGHPGKGGNTMVMLANQEGVVKGHDGSIIWIDPTTLKFGPNTRINGADEVNIYGGENWTMEVNNLREGAITALKQITFAVGQGGVIDFRGSAPGAIKAGACHVNSLDVVYILDTSTSMDKELADGQKRIDAAKQAIIALNSRIAQHNDNNRVALVTFDNTGKVWSDFNNDLNSVSQTVSDLNLHGYTRLHKGVNIATELLSNRQNTDNQPVVILFSDGMTPESQAHDSLDNLKAIVPNIMIHSVGIGDSAATSVLQYAVQVGDGNYYATNDTDSLTTALQEAVADAVCPDNDDTAEVRIFADNVLLDEGMTLEKLINAPNIVQGPAKIIYNAAWSGVGYLEDEPGVTLVIPLTLFNGGPIQDTYAINVSDSAGWPLGDLPETIRVNGLRRTELELLVTLPNTDGVQNTVTVTATSQSDSSVVVSQNIQIGVTPKSDNSGEAPIESLSTSGVLRDRFQQPIIGALVQIGDRVAITDNTGHWQIDGLVEGEHPVTVTKEGYTFKTDNCNIGLDQPCAPKMKATSELAITVSSGSQSLAQGDDLTYIITVTNNGSQTATDIALIDVLPKNVELVSLQSLDGGICDMNAVACTLPHLSPGDSTQAKLVIKNHQADKLSNTVEIASNEYPSDIVKTWVTVTPYLSVAITDSPDPVATQGTVHYSFDVALSPSAPTDATTVELVVQLPTGVELQSTHTEYGLCETDNLPTVTCSLTDLSVNSADSVSHITVDMAVDLTDPGLLLLTTKAEVSADEYPSHSERERTKIFIDPDVKVDMVFVIDDSNSMQQEIDSIVTALKQFIATVDKNTAPFIALVTFKDQVTVRAASRDMNVLLNAIETLKASGGGMCEEASAEALEIAIKHLKDGGSILLATDASPYNDADIEGLVTLLRNKTMKLNTLLTGDCTNKDSWNGVNDE